MQSNIESTPAQLTQEDAEFLSSLEPKQRAAVIDFYKARTAYETARIVARIIVLEGFQKDAAIRGDFPAVMLLSNEISQLRNAAGAL